MTGFSCWPGFLGVVSGGGCLDLIDHHRLLTYLENCPADPRRFRVRCCACYELWFTEGGVPRTFGCPSTDPAPWFNPSDPAWMQDVAGRFYGAEILTWDPQPVGYVTATGPRVAHRPRRGKMRVEATVRLWGDGCDATLYGMEWFQRTLECQTCNGLQLRLLRTCDDTFDPADPYATGGHWWRDVFAARILVEPEPDPADGSCCTHRDVAIVIEADDPCSYWNEPSVECIIGAPWRAAGDEDLFPAECRCGPLCPCPDPIGVCVGDCLPDASDPRAILSTVRVGCYCTPFSTCRKVCEIPASATPGLSDAVLAVTITSVGAPTSNLRVWLWRTDPSPGPDASAADWDRWRCQVPCTTIDIGELRADDVVYIDGRDRTVRVVRQTETCELEVTSMGEPLNWPVLNCAESFWVAVEYDTYATSPALEVTAAVYPRECWTT